MKPELSQTRALRRAGLALFALLTIPTAIAVLAGCSRVVAPPIAFAQGGLTADYTFVEGQQIAAVTLPAAMNGSEGLTYSLTPPIPGLTLHESTRVLSGTPMAAGTYPVTYTATNAEGKTASLNLVITVVNSFTAVNYLRGTWWMTDEWWEDGVMIGTRIDTVTFTASRYILRRAHFFTDGTSSKEDDWTESGTWKSTESTVTRIRIEDHDDDDDTPEVETTATTGYHWGDESRSKLLMLPWVRFEEGDSGYRLYTRVVDAVPDLVGTWVEDEGDDGFLMFTLNADGTMAYRSYRPGRWDFTFEAEWTHDADEQFIVVTDVSENAVWALETPGGSLRFGYAATNTPGELLISGWWREEGVKPGSCGSCDPRTYGGYWHVFIHE